MGRQVLVTRQQDRRKNSRARGSNRVILSIYQTRDPSPGVRINPMLGLPPGACCSVRPRNATPEA